MRIRKEIQLSEVSDEVSALFAMVRPILKGLLYSLKREHVDDVGGYRAIKLDTMFRLYRSGDGEVGICFEYAVHDAINVRSPQILDRIQTALSLCRIGGDLPSSLLFGAEKTGALSLVSSIKSQLTDDSRLLSGTRGQPAKLRKHIDAVAASFRKLQYRDLLPYSICDTWKADLFIGQPTTDQWVATTIKINPSTLQGGRGLRIGIIPMHQGTSDSVRKDDSKNLIICPLPYDRSFMELFYRSWIIVKTLMNSGCNMPSETMLPVPPDRFVCHELVQRGRFRVIDVIEALDIFSQSHLLSRDNEKIAEYATEVATIDNLRSDPLDIASSIMPYPQISL